MHKKIEFDLPEIYIPVQVNAKVNGEWPGYIHDSDGDNISEKNCSYCELTAMYWLWKNSDADIKGLCHYRRYFSNDEHITMSEANVRPEKNMYKYVLQKAEIEHYLQDFDAIVVRPYRPYPMCEYDDLNRWCYEKDIEVLKRAVINLYPDYLPAYNEVMQSTNLSHFNMIITKARIFDDYSKWLFTIMSEVEKNTNIQNYDIQHKRIYGYLAEALLNVYIKKNNLNVKYSKLVVPATFMNVSKFRMNIRRCWSKVQNFALFIKIYWIIELLYKTFRPKQFNKYIAYKNAMKSEE